MTWAQFAREAPELAAFAEERMKASGLVLVGTLRSDGLPRISPVEPLIVDARLMLGMMYRSRKALDLLRDPRCLVQTTVRDREDSSGELKLRGRASEIDDPEAIERYCQALYAAINWRPEGRFHLFALDIERADLVQYTGSGDQRLVEWLPGSPPRERLRRFSGGGLVD